MIQTFLKGILYNIILQIAKKLSPINNFTGSQWFFLLEARYPCDHSIEVGQ